MVLLRYLRFWPTSKFTVFSIRLEKNEFAQAPQNKIEIMKFISLLTYVPENSTLGTFLSFRRQLQKFTLVGSLTEAKAPQESTTQRLSHFSVVQNKQYLLYSK